MGFPSRHERLSAAPVSPANLHISMSPSSLNCINSTRLLRDRDAVIAGLTLPWNSGVVEGHASRIKMLKRLVFDRAGLALLRKRVLLAP